MRKKYSIAIAVSIMFALAGCDTNDKVSEHMAIISMDTSVEMDDSSTKQTENTFTEVIIQKGNYTLEECKEYGKGGYGIYIMYPDGSLDDYYTGYPLIKDGPQLMTYGNEYTYENLIINTDDDKKNFERIKDGQLILYFPENNKIQSGLFPVEFSGCTISRINEESKREALFFTKWGEELYINSWVSGKSINFGGWKCETINGITMDAFGESQTSNNNKFKYFSLNENETYTLGIVEGTALVETEYIADQYYYFQKENEKYDLNLIATADGYANCDFTDIPEGDYILYYSYWDEELNRRNAWLTHVTIN